MNTCAYVNCTETTSGTFCSQQCETWHKRESVSKRRSIIRRVVTPHWKTARELWEPCQLEGYEGSYTLFNNDLEYLARKGVIERMVLHVPGSHGAKFAQYRVVG